VKRAELLRAISRAARARKLSVHLERRARHGELFRIGSVLIKIPRHRDIGLKTTFAIRRELETVLGKDWWR